jgi:hypothetical protein
MVEEEVVDRYSIVIIDIRFGMNIEKTMIPLEEVGERLKNTSKGDDQRTNRRTNRRTSRRTNQRTNRRKNLVHLLRSC